MWAIAIKMAISEEDHIEEREKVIDEICPIGFSHLSWALYW